MTVVRELVTKLGFQFDRSNLDKLERSIIGFKTKASIALGLIGTLAKKTIDFFGGIADGVVETKDLADYSNIALENFVALRSAAAKFSIKPTQFNQSVEKLSISIKQASRGFGELFRLAEETQGKVNFRGLNGELLNVKDILFQIGDYINSIGDKSEKLRILGNIFSPESAGAWLRFLEQGNEQIGLLVEKETEFAKGFQASVDGAIKLQNQISELSVQWDKFATKILELTVPSLVNFFSSINKFIDDVRSKGVWETITTNASQIDPRSFTTGVPRLKPEFDPESEVYKRMQIERDQAVQNQNSTSIINNNNFQFNVPAGTPEQTASYTVDQVQKTLDQFWLEKTREIINNNPQVE